MPILTTSDLKVSYGELDVFSDLSLEVSERARIGMVGPNGAGKTSLLRVLVGELEPDGGSVQGATGIRIGYVPQVSQDASSDTLGNQIMSAFDELVRLERALADSALEIQTGDDRARREAERRYSSLLAEYETQGGYDYESRMERVAAGVGLSAEDLKTPAASASGGERTRAALATALLNEPGLLLLDEPTNYLDFKGLAWLEQFLAQSSHAFIAVSHDRYFLDRVATEIWEMDRGRVKTYRGSYTTYRALETERAARRQKEYDRQQEHIASEESFIDRYRAGQRARQARGREKRLDRLKETALIESPQAQRTIHIGGIPAASRAGQIVVSVKGLGVGFVEGDRSVELLSALDMKLEIGSRTAVIGSNGVGKTTLVQTILGMTPPLAGQATLGHNVKVGYHRQGSDDLPGSYTVLEAMQEYRNVPIGEERNYLARFLFGGDDVFKRVSSLSGGERARLAVARLLVTEPNFLVLDEPTTHLDIPSREALEQALSEYDGTLLFISHDRHLISLLAHQLWIVEDGTVDVFTGSFQEWASQSKEFAPPLSPKSKRRMRRRARAVGKTAAPAAKPGTPTPDYEAMIAELESRLARIERDLLRASDRQDVDDVVRLGEEHDKTQLELAEMWEMWAE